MVPVPAQVATGWQMFSVMWSRTMKRMVVSKRCSAAGRRCRLVRTWGGMLLNADRNRQVLPDPVDLDDDLAEVSLVTGRQRRSALAWT